MNAFVTGGAGFIGSHLVDKLITRGDFVTVYDNLSSGKKQFLAQHLKNDNFRIIEADLLDLDRLKKEINGHDVVFHLAANPFVRLGEKQTRLDLEQGAIVTYNILEAMRVNDIKKIVFASSSVVYAETPPIILPSRSLPEQESFGFNHPTFD